MRLTGTVRAITAVALLFTTFGAAKAEAAADLRVQRLRCEYRENPLGIGETKPRLSWQLRAGRRDARGQRQRAYRILVASSEAILGADRGDLWDSGRVDSDRSVHVVYGGAAPLASGQRCFWKVRVWDQDDRPAPFSKPAFWEMGLLGGPDDWRDARWITAPSSDAAAAAASPALEGASWIWAPGGDAAAGVQRFRRRLVLPGDAVVRGARIVISADDQFTLWVNGREAGKSGGQADAWREPVIVDLTRHLVPGDNILAVEARNTGGPAGLIARVVVDLDGREPVAVITDGKWRVGPDGGDAAAPVGADRWRAAFDDTAWPAAREVAPFGAEPWGRLSPAGISGPARYLRRAFRVGGPGAVAVRRARLYVTALGVYEPYLNGRRVGDDVFAPGWTDYRKRVPHQTYDVTRLLRTGNNVLGIVLGDGWYAGHVGLAGRAVYGDIPAAACLLRIEYADGRRETVVSDALWQATDNGPIRRADLLMGETYDAGREIAGWSDPAAWDARAAAPSPWRPAVVRDGVVGAAPLVEPQRDSGVRRTEEIPARGVTEPKPGVFVFDLGQNLVGWARLKTRGPAGSRITLRFAEMLNPDGTIYTANYRGARCTDEYVLRGDRNGETWEPRFTFRGFRYVEMTGRDPAGRKPGLDAVTGVVVHSEMPRAGTMETSSPLVNRLLANIDWGQRGNFLSVPTDCPQRDERLGWTGDAQIFVRTATYHRDVAAFFTKWLLDLEDAQSAAGAFPDVAPRVAAGEGVAAWGDAGVICPWTQYLVYGDRAALEARYPSMTRWIAYCEKNSRGLLRPAEGYGDWLSIAADTPKDVLATAYFAHSTRLVARAAAALGKAEDAARYEDLFRRIGAAFQAAYVTEDGRVRGDTQTGYVLALRFDLLRPEQRAGAARRLVADILGDKKGHLSTGFVGVGALCPVLTETGNTDVAYRLLLNETFPSWGYSIRQGATTIWERWDGWTRDQGFQDPGMNSFNHYALGSVGEWLFASVGGIDLDPAEPAFKHVVVKPDPGSRGDLTHCKTRYESVHGPIATEWRRERDRFLVTVELPPNTRGTVYVRADDPADVTESGRRVSSDADGVTFLRHENGFAVFSVGSGVYRFAAPAADVSGARSAQR